MGGTPREQTIVFFDGVCHLCNGFVDFAISRDRQRNLRFAPLQGSTARQMLSESQRLDLRTVVVLRGERIFIESAAVIEVLSAMGGPWRVFATVARLCPRFLRDPLYRFVARHRLKWFGERDFCRRPLPEEKEVLWD